MPMIMTPPPKSTLEGLADFQFTFELGDPTQIPPRNPYSEPAETLDDLEDIPDSVRNYPVAFGRTFHAFKAGSYPFPNDAAELDREVLQFHIFHALMGRRLHLAPLSRAHPPRRILDVATGVGEWAIGMADEYPTAHVYGIDLSPVQPEMVPPNVQFIIQDASQPWDFPDLFDYIHAGTTSGCWADFKTEITDQAFHNLTPGGWFECSELSNEYGCDDGTLPADSPLLAWAACMARAACELSRPIDFAHRMRRQCEAAGFVDVHERVFYLPINGWHRDPRLRELGHAWQEAFSSGLPAFTVPLYHRAWGWTMEQTELALVPVRKVLADTRVHAFHKLHVVWGRKPHPGEKHESGS